MARFNGEVKYCIFDPAGNITALIETGVDAALQPAVASEIMKRHPEVEQAGFVDLDSISGAEASLRMAGGEFCGNATMCTAALYMLRKGMDGTADLKVRVSGAPRSLEVKLRRKSDTGFDTSVIMPPAISIKNRFFSIHIGSLTLEGELPVVHMGGIDHMIIEQSSPFYALQDKKEAAGTVIRKLCEKLGADCLGMMFLADGKPEDGGTGYELLPLVYVPGADTLFWENSCASGSAAAGMYLADKKGGAVRLILHEPGGSLTVESDPFRGETRLFSTAVMTSELTEKIDTGDV